MFKVGPGEKIIMEVRRHWFVIFLEGLLIFLLALFPLILFYLVNRFFLVGKEIEIGGNPIYLFSFVYFLWLLGMWTIFFIMWTEFYLDVWYITDKRIIAIDQKGLFSREVIDLRYEKVQDATVEIRGIIPTLLNYGDIQIETAGTYRDIILKQAKNPADAKREILLHHSNVLERGSGIVTGPMSE